MVVGITGGIGSGKTTIVNMFAKFKNVVVYIADVEAKKIMNTSLDIREQLIKEFSEEVFLNNTLNRSFLAGIVFKDKEKLKKLNTIVHPVVSTHFNEFIKNNSDKDYILYENAILFENGSNELCDKIITVTAPLNLRIQRVVSRDSITKQLVEDRIKNQWKDVKKTLQSHYIVNNILLNESEALVLCIHNKLTKK